MENGRGREIRTGGQSRLRRRNPCIHPERCELGLLFGRVLADGEGDDVRRVEVVVADVDVDVAVAAAPCVEALVWTVLAMARVASSRRGRAHDQCGLPSAEHDVPARKGDCIFSVENQLKILCPVLCECNGDVKVLQIRVDAPPVSPVPGFVVFGQCSLILSADTSSVQ